MSVAFVKAKLFPHFRCMKVKNHYDNHLGNFYSWMVGEFNLKQEEQQDFFSNSGIKPFKTKTAIDLGCGHGLQSVSLARLGFKVHAIDFNKQLLKELGVRKKDLPIFIREAGIIEFLKEFNEQADAVVCMGDTLTHLDNAEAVDQVIRESYRKLEADGKLVLSFRDLSSALADDQRFLPVRSDSSRVHTCFLEYFDDRVHVYDLLHEWDGKTWKQSVSWYPKLRLSESVVVGMISQCGYRSIERSVINGMIFLVALK